MSQKPFLFIKILLVLLVFNATSYAENLKILPKKKPDLNKEVIAKKIVQGVLKPKPKPKKDIEIKKKEIKKTQKKIEKIEDKSVTKKKVLFLVPKSKPLIVKKEIEKSKKKSKYFRQKDYILAKKAIQEIEKKKWSKALAISKKAKDKSITLLIVPNEDVDDTPVNETVSSARFPHSPSFHAFAPHPVARTESAFQ